MSILEQSLESYPLKDKNDSQEEKTIVMQGPLSDIIYRALNIVYNKSNDEVKLSDFALESVAQDIVIANNIMEAVGTDDAISEEPNYVIFGVSKQEVDEQDVVEVKRLLDNKKDADVIVMITDDNGSTDLVDNPIQTNGNGHISAMTSLESLLDKHYTDQKVSIIRNKSFKDSVGVLSSILGGVGSILTLGY